MRASGTRCILRPSSSSTTPSSTPASRPGKRRLPVDRLGRHQLRQPSLETPVIRFVPKRSIEPGRRNLERVGLSERRGSRLVLLDVEQRAQILADALAVGDADRVFFGLAPVLPWIRPIDDDPQHRADRFAAQLDVEHFEPVAPRHAFRGLADAFQLFEQMA